MMSDMPERIWACMDDYAHPYSPKGYWIVNNHDSEDVEYVLAERERELVEVLREMMTISDRDHVIWNRAKDLLIKFERRKNNV